MKLSWRGFGRKLYGKMPADNGNVLKLEWNYLGSETVYELYSFRKQMTLLILRIPDQSWQDREPRIFEPTAGEMDNTLDDV